MSLLLYDSTLLTGMNCNGCCVRHVVQLFFQTSRSATNKEGAVIIFSSFAHAGRVLYLPCKLWMIVTYGFKNE